MFCGDWPFYPQSPHKAKGKKKATMPSKAFDDGKTGSLALS